MNPENNTFIGTIELIKQSFAFYKKYTKEIILLLLAPAVILAILNAFQAQIEEVTQFELVNDPMHVIGFAVAILLSILFSFISMVLLSVFLVRNHTEIVPIKEVFKSSWKLLLPLAGFGILFYLVVIGGFIGFIIPGIMLSLGLMFGPFLVIKGKSITESFFASWKMTYGVKWKMFLRLILLGIFNAIAAGCIAAIVGFAIPNFVGNIFFGLIMNLIITPIYFGAIFFLYEHVRTLPTIIHMDTAERKGMKRMFIVVGSAGILAIIATAILLSVAVKSGVFAG